MRFPAYATVSDRLFYYAYIAVCALIFAFLVAPILVIIPLSFNAEPYFTFTEEMLRLNPEGYSLRWYRMLGALGMQNPDETGLVQWWSDLWANATWVDAAKNSLIIGFWTHCCRRCWGRWRRSASPGRRCRSAGLSWRS